MSKHLSIVTLFAAIGLSGSALAAGVEAGAKVGVTTPSAADVAADAKVNAATQSDAAMEGMHDMHEHGAEMGHEAVVDAKAGAGAVKDATVSTAHKVGAGAEKAGKKTKHAAKSLTGAAGSALGSVGGAVQGTADAATSGVNVEAGAKVEKQ